MSSQPQLQRVINIDASSLSSLNCYRRYWTKFVLGLCGESLPYNDTELGSAWHVFRNVLAKEHNEAKAVTAALNYFAARMQQGMIVRKDRDHLDADYLTQLCMKYLHKFGKEKSFGKYEYLNSPIDGQPLVEQSFSIKLFENDMLRINFQGTMDEFVIHPAGYIIIGDDKTTSKWDVKKHLGGFRMKPQLKVYRLAVQLLAEQPGGEWFKELLETKRIGCRINGVFLKKSVNDVEFHHGDVIFYDDDELTTFRMMLRDLVDRIAKDVIHGSPGVHPPPEGMLNDTCVSSYCEFAAACKMPESVYNSMLNNYAKRSYEPLNFRKL